jgi:opacity protein-like surface antigen
MKQSILCSVLSVSVFFGAVAPVAVQAQSRDAVTSMCRNALIARGYGGYGFEREEYSASRSGASLTGQIVRGSDRLEFNCVVDGRSVQDVSINRLSGDNRSSNAAGAVIAAAAILGIAALAHHEKTHRGPPPDDANRLAEHERGYRDGLYNAPYNNYSRNDDYQGGYDAGVNERTNYVAHNQRNQWGGRHGAPAEVQMACASEADRYWRVRPGTTVPLSSKSTGSGMYEVSLSAGWQRGTCTVTERGDVKSIMND